MEHPADLDEDWSEHRGEDDDKGVRTEGWGASPFQEAGHAPATVPMRPRTKRSREFSAFIGTTILVALGVSARCCVIVNVSP